MRSWCYDVEAAHRVGTAAPPRALTPIDPWHQPTLDPAWLERGETVVDVANTPWGALPCDWRDRFRDLAAIVAPAIVLAFSAGFTWSELDDDDDRLEAIVDEIARDWLRELPRVTWKGKTVREEKQFAAARWIFVRRAVSVCDSYLRRTAAADGEDRPGIMIGGQEKRDRKYATFRLVGPAIDGARLGHLGGLRLGAAHAAGDLVLDPMTGEPCRIARFGLWSVTSENEVEEIGPTIEEHVVWLLDRLEPHADALRAELARDPEGVAEMLMYWSMDGVNADFSFAPGVIERVAALGAHLRMDVWAWGDDDEDDEDD